MLLESAKEERLYFLPAVGDNHSFQVAFPLTLGQVDKNIYNIQKCHNKILVFHKWTTKGVRWRARFFTAILPHYVLSVAPFDVGRYALVPVRLGCIP